MLLWLVFLVMCVVFFIFFRFASVLFASVGFVVVVSLTATYNQNVCLCLCEWKCIITFFSITRKILASKMFGFENFMFRSFFFVSVDVCVCVFVASISLFVVLMQFKWLNCTQRFAYLCVRVMYGDFGVVYSPNMYMNVSYIWNLSLRLSMLGLYTTENVQTLGKYWRLAWKLGPNFSKQAS